MKPSDEPVTPAMWNKNESPGDRPVGPAPDEAPPPEPGPDPQAIALVPEPPAQARLADMAAATNPLLEASQRLLRALADIPDLPDAMDGDAIVVFHRLLVREVTTFQSLCAEAKIRHDHAVAASYCLCTAIDEAASSTAWGGGLRDGTTHGVGLWAGRQLAAKFHGDSKGGEKFFLLIGRLASSPREHIDLIELMYQILGLGFEGRFVVGEGAARQLETIRRRLYTMLAEARGEVPQALSPPGPGVLSRKPGSWRTVPVWVVAALMSLALLGLFSWHTYHLHQTRSAVEARIRAIGALRPPPQPAHKPLRLKELLSAEIARGTVSVDEDDARSIVSFRGDDMFVPGQARMNAKVLPVIAKVAGEVNEVAGSVRVTGHSDNRPISTKEFPDNLALSEKRAGAVADVLKANGVVPARVKVEGRGDAAPVADKATPAGRARNRRVEIAVTQAVQ